MTPEEVVEHLRPMLEEQRKEFIGQLLDTYCQHCGSTDGKRCVCMKDE
jgi:hypothetical protein